MASDEKRDSEGLTTAVRGLSHARRQFLLVHSKLQDNTKGLTCIDLVRLIDEAAAMCTKTRADLEDSIEAARSEAGDP